MNEWEQLRLSRGACYKRMQYEHSGKIIWLLKNQQEGHRLQVLQWMQGTTIGPALLLGRVNSKSVSSKAKDSLEHNIPWLIIPSSFYFVEAFLTIVAGATFSRYAPTAPSLDFLVILTVAASKLRCFQVSQLSLLWLSSYSRVRNKGSRLLLPRTDSLVVSRGLEILSFSTCPLLSMV